MATCTQQFLDCDKCGGENAIRHLNLHTNDYWFECLDCGWFERLSVDTDEEEDTQRE